MLYFICLPTNITMDDDDGDDDDVVPFHYRFNNISIIAAERK